MAKRRPDMDDSDDLGFRTPTKKKARVKTGKQQRPSKKETGRQPRTKKETGRRPRPQKEAEAKKETGRRPRPQKEVEQAPPIPRRGGKGQLLGLGLGLVAAALIGGVLVLVMSGGEPAPQPVIGNRGRLDLTPIVDAPKPRETAPPVRPLQPVRPVTPPPTPVPRVNPGEPVRPTPPPSAEPQKDDILAEMAKRSAAHASVAQVLEELARLYGLDAMRAGPLLDHFRERQKKEDELIARLREMGPWAVEALSDMILGLENRQYRIFMGKALAGIEDPAALGAVAQILSQVKDVALQTTLVRFLPENPDAARTVAGAIEGEQNPSLRCMLMREYNRRLGKQDDSGRDLFSRMALEDKDPNVRAEAVTIIGRRGDPRDSELMEKIISSEPNLHIKQRATVAYAETAGASALPFLEELARTEGTTLAMRASAVLAIGRIGGDEAIQSLDVIAQTDPEQAIRTRANRLAQSLRRRQQQPQTNPLPTAPMGPLDRR